MGSDAVIEEKQSTLTKSERKSKKSAWSHKFSFFFPPPLFGPIIPQWPNEEKGNPCEASVGISAICCLCCTTLLERQSYPPSSAFMSSQMPVIGWCCYAWQGREYLLSLPSRDHGFLDSWQWNCLRQNSQSLDIKENAFLLSRRYCVNII